MSETQKESPEFGIRENRCGVILGYWDHEKTPTLIQDLEYSVNLIEGKCKELLEELIYYKKCLEESQDIDWNFSNFKDKSGFEKSQSLCGNEPDDLFRKNFSDSQETEQIFEEKFKRKLSGINKDLTEVGHKIGLKNNIVLFPTNDYLKTLNSQIEVKAEKSWCHIRDKFMKGYFFKVNGEPDPVLIEHARDAEFAKITKTEFDLYQELSKLNLRRRRKLKVRGATATSSKRRKLKFSGRWKICRFRQDFQASSRFEGKKPKSGKEKCKKRKKKRVTMSRMSTSNSARISCSTMHSQWKLNGSKAYGTCKPSLSETFGDPAKAKRRSRVEAEKGLAKGRSAVRVSVSQNVQGGARAGNIFSQDGATHVEKGKFRKSPNVTMQRRQCTNGQKSLIRTRPKRGYDVGSQIMVSDRQRIDVLEGGIGNDGLGKASGDGSSRDGWGKLSKEWIKAYSSFLGIYRKYLTLKKRLTGSNSELAHEDLKYPEKTNLENQVDNSLGKYKKFLKFHSQFLDLNQRLRPLEIAREATLFGLARNRKSWGCSSTFPLR